MNKKNSMGAIFALAIFGMPIQANADTLLNIGTGSITGLFYPTGGFVCNLLNKSRATEGHDIRCSVESTPGTVSNLRNLRRGALDVTLAMSSLQYDANIGQGVFAEEGANEDMRFLMSFTTNQQHAVVRADAGITHVRELRGKRVNTGNPGSGTEATAYMLLDYFDIDPEKDLALDSKLTSREQVPALCDGKIDAFMFPSAVPNPSLVEATNTCDVKLVPLNGPELDRLLEENSYFGPSVIPGGTYDGTDEDVPTFAYAATLLTSADLPDEVAYQLVKAVFENFEDFKKNHPAFADMERKKSITFGKSVTPYHPGAERYYQEAGLLP